ncbi:DUF134 domain-containing protein [Sporomusa sphaeroides DSM 2875]|jgi:predicted DNA-binding protein (UPF0251 family)|uniref:DUF134 domain-containing protein n=1 Tax=Sporomusa sphaeroides TaxID=47679 RepID=UPI002030371E|nr:DUF134 domain-containing protein [Sporomusa sphaeroides]MCM0757872.1 DUF134 domain-containing protein [Sporomusa sphaeroides DSM 2875]
MARPHKERRVEQLPPVTHYKPAGVPLRDLEEVTLTIEEMEAIRLADIEQLDQGTAAASMDVSRPTFHRIVNSAHQKIAAALWGGHALRVDGGTFRIAHRRTMLRHFVCHTCGHNWTLPHGNGQRCHDLLCPACQASTVSHNDE